VGGGVRWDAPGAVAVAVAVVVAVAVAVGLGVGGRGVRLPMEAVSYGLQMHQSQAVGPGK
jgi:hypothetical protein